MAGSSIPVYFEDFEHGKENIEPKSQGHAAAALAKAFALDSHVYGTTSEHQRSEFESRITDSEELDDPLEVWVEYIQWIMDTFPIGNNPESGLLHALERCTRMFVDYLQYKDDIRYLRIWLQYSRYFDAPLEIFSYLQAHGIGHNLALFYEEASGLMESRGMHGTAKDTYELGISRNARPLHRLQRKYNEFLHRSIVNDEQAVEHDTYAVPHRTILGQHAFENHGETTGRAVGSSSKIAVFTDNESTKYEDTNPGPKGWQSLNTIRDRIKENTMVARPWMGETLLVKTKVQSHSKGVKLPIYQDQVAQSERHALTQYPVISTPGKRSEVVMADMNSIYAVDKEEFSFEELRAKSRGLLNPDWTYKEVKSIELQKPLTPFRENACDVEIPLNSRSVTGVTKKAKQMASPTINTKAALADILDIFNQPLKCDKSVTREVEESTDGEDQLDDQTETASLICKSFSCKKDEVGKVSIKSNEEINTSTHTDDARFWDQKEEDSKQDLDYDNKEIVNDFLDNVQNFDENLLDTTSEKDDQTRTPSTPLTRFLPDRKPAPFNPMTPIEECTEASLLSIHQSQKLLRTRQSFVPPLSPIYQDLTPSRSHHDESPRSSPFIEFVEPRAKKPAISRDVTLNEILENSDTSGSLKGESTLPDCDVASEQHVPSQALKSQTRKGPIIEELVCNPMDETIRKTITKHLYPPLQSYHGFHIRSDLISGMSETISKYVRNLRRSGESNLNAAPQIVISEVNYYISRKLGEGAFAPVYLIQGSNQSRVQRFALKIEKPSNPWEFYITRQAKRRLGTSRAAESIIDVKEVYLYKDESQILLEYHDHGTILDLVNRTRHNPHAGNSGVLDEAVVAFLAVDLLRTVEGLHTKGILHGDLKPDNCLLRLRPLPDDEWSGNYYRDGSHGWNNKGIYLIDFGRGIDMTQFSETVQFIADWKMDDQDCAEMREARPWTYQVDYHGIANIIHLLLFGNYIKTIAESMPGAGRKRYRLTEPFKRYWQQQIWSNLFDVLLNPLTASDHHSRLPITNLLAQSREQLEEWLEEAYDRGIGLKALLKREEVSLAGGQGK